MKKLTTWLLQEILVNNADRYAPSLREYAAGENIFKTGDPADYLAVLLAGSIEIRKHDKLLTIVESGSIFGEMGLIDGLPRSADAVANSQCRIALIREGQFKAMLASTPTFAISIMGVLTERLRNNVET